MDNLEEMDLCYMMDDFAKCQSDISINFIVTKLKELIRNNPNLFHITLSMLTLNNANKVKASQIMD